MAALVLLILISAAVETVATDAQLVPVPHAQMNVGNHRASDYLIVPRDVQAQSRTRTQIPGFPGPISGGGQIVSAFVVQGDVGSLRRLAAVGSSLDLVFPDTLAFSTSDGRIRSSVSAEFNQLRDKLGFAVMPRISNTDPQGRWATDELSKLLRSDRGQRAFLEALVDHLRSTKAIGVNLDIEGLERADASLFLDFVSLVTSVLHEHKFFVTVDVPMNDDNYDYEVLGKIADAVVLMAYDEHFPTGKPGAIAGMEWFGDGVREYAARVPREKLIVALGAYGYDWAAGKEAVALSFEESLELARAHSAVIHTEEVSLNSTFSYKAGTGEDHSVYLLDAVSAWNQLRFIESLAAPAGGESGKLAGVSLWRLGLEEPAVCDLLLAPSLDSVDLKQLRHLPIRAEVTYSGTGTVFRVHNDVPDGHRSLTLNGNVISYAEYDKLADPFELEAVGVSPAPLVSLTFDDGPDPKYTPQLLDVLADENVQATFFVVGRQVEAYPDIVARAVREGHFIGNHTYDHPHLESIGPTRLRAELNATQRAIESACGRQTLLFRSPYDTDSSPSNLGQLKPLSQVSAMGYFCVGANSAAEDYRHLPAEVLVQQVMDQLHGPGPFVVCLHDAGGDRSQTVEAVRRLIPKIRAAGLRIAGLDEVADLRADAINAAVPPVELPATLGTRVLAAFRNTGSSIISWIFLISTIIAMIRITGLGLVMFLSRNRKPAAEPTNVGPVSILVPAYNEGAVIRRTIDGLLASTYPDFKVLVINDGSSDDTADIVRDISRADPRVVLIDKPNGGKSSALNLGLVEAKTDLVVVLDGDTIVMPQTIAALVAPFADPAVTAVCGNVQVGNIRNLLTAMQDVEYVTCQNYDRRAFDALNCIGVVPGATGAWRRQAVLDAGSYSHDTLTEDADLTLEVLRRGGKIVYAPEARSVTEVPETVSALYRQRFRWAFGTFQTLYKHRAAFFKGTLGWIGMPNHLIFQAIFPMLAPIGDAVLLYSLFTGQWNAVASGYFTFILMDLVGSAIALRLDNRPLWRLWTVFVQRFCYRQFMYFVTFAALIASIRGRRHGWNKLERLNSVEVPDRLLAAD